LQVVQGPTSPLRYFTFTNPTEAVGVFANRNHYAAFLYAALVFVGVRLLTEPTQPSTNNAMHGKTVIAILVIVALLTGIALARSRAAGALAGVAIVSIVLIMLAEQRNNRPSSVSHRWLAGLFGVAMLIAIQLGMSRFATRLDQSLIEDGRLTFAPTTFEAIVATFPFGTGVGSFVPIYAVLEKQRDLFAAFANRAHNDWLEFGVEAGVLGIATMALFLAWLVRWTFWPLREKSTDHETSDAQARLTALGAALVIVLLLLHSAFDYPLRTTALAVTFALCCGLLLPSCAVPRIPASIRRPSSGGPSVRAARPTPPPPPAWNASEPAAQAPKSQDQGERT